MRIIRIGFSRPKKLKIGAKLITWWLNSNYSHVYMLYTDDQGRELIFHASQGLVHLITKENFDKENETVKLVDLYLLDSNYQLFRDFYYSKLGSPYDYIDLIRVVLHDIGIPNMGINNSGFICSELCGQMLIDLFGCNFNKPANLITPKDIERELKGFL